MALRKVLWRLKYRPGRKITFCGGYDAFTEVLIVENRLASKGTLVYRQRGVNVFGAKDVCDDFGPLREDTVPNMIRRATTGEFM